MRYTGGMKTKKLTAEAENAIAAGLYGPSGARFPSVRQYMQETGISYKTAYGIFKALEEKGHLLLTGNGWYVTRGICALDTPLYTLSKSKRRIGIHVKEINNPYIAENLRNIQKLLRQRGIETLISTSENDEAEERRILASFVGLGCRGVINFPSVSEGLADFYNRYPLPMVFIGRQIEGCALPFIATDNYQTGRRVGKFLRSMGYGEFYYLAPSVLSETQNERYRGFRDYFRENGLFLSSENLYKSDLEDDNMFRFIAEALKRKQRASGGRLGLFCLNDLFAVKIISYLNRAQVNVPREVGVVGYDNLPVAAQSALAVTTVSYSFKELSQKALSILEEAVKTREIPQKLPTVESVILARKSTCDFSDS